MRKIATLLALGMLVATVALAANPVRISQVYGGGGNSGAYYKYDYVELYNSGTVPVDIGGWSIQYASATGTIFGATSGTTFFVQFPAGATIPACGYYLIQLAAGASTTAVNLPVAADIVGNIAVGGTACKMGLASSGTSSSCAGPWVDLVGVGPTANCSETAPTAVMSNTTAAVRKLAGATDTDNNANDFQILTCDGTLPIHNSSMANPECLATPTSGNTWGTIKTLYR